jgi:hypothetical protein
MTRLMGGPGRCSPLRWMYRSRSLGPRNYSIHLTSCEPPDWTIGVEGLSPSLFHAGTGVPSA